MNPQLVRCFVFCFAFVGSLLRVGLVHAQQTSTHTTVTLPERTLRIETGMHTSAISTIDVDSARHYLVSASHDGTARLWDLRSGDLLQTFRSTSLTRRGIDISGTAISPSANVVAVAKLGGILLFDPATGRLFRQLAVAPQISRLTFSQDGRFLAVGEYGVTVFRTSDYSQVFHEASEDFAPTLGVDFAKDGRLAICSGKLIRVYSSDFKLIAARATTNKGLPFSVRFSPDNKKIAVGMIFGDSVEVLSAADLQPIVALQAPPIRFSLRAGADLQLHGSSAQAQYIGVSVCWSQDSTKLYAACGTKIRSWKKQEAKSVRDFDIDGSVTCIQSLPDGGVLYSLSRPGWGSVNNQGKATVSVGPPTVNFWKNPIYVSRDGSTIGFRFLNRPEDPVAIFDIKKRLLSAARDLTREELSSPIIASDALALSDFDNGAGTAKLNGKALPASGPTRCLAIAPDKRSFLIGAATESKLFDKDGMLKQRISAPIGAEALSATITPDGMTCVIGYSDGTIRWNRLSDGRELLAFFIHADGKRWVLFTPGGYYDCSPDAEQLIGWQVSAGLQRAADFFPVSHFRETFYRPDMTSFALQRDAALTTTTDGDGTITEFTPGSTIVLNQSGGPKTYRLSKKVLYVTRSGKELDEATVRTRLRAGIPVRVHYVSEGDDLVIDRVILDEDSTPIPGPPTPPPSPSTSATPSPIVPYASPSASAESSPIITQASPTASASPKGILASTPTPTPESVPDDPLKHLPPIIRILSPANNSDTNVGEVTLEYLVRSAADPIRRIRARIDDRPSEVSEDLQAMAGAEQSGKIVVTIPNRDCRVSLLADTEFATSDPATVSLRWRGPAVPVTNKSTLYLLAIGVCNYKNDPDFHLDYAIKDAEDLANAMLQQRGLCYRDVKIKTLTDATRLEIMEGFDWLKKNTTSDDVAMVFMSGHGTNDDSRTWYFLPSDYLAQQVRGTGLRAADISKIIEDTHGRAFIVFLDSCFSGNAMVGGQTGFYDVNQAVMELANPTTAGAVVFSASAGAQLSREDPQWKNGAFTKALVEGLTGAADLMKRGQITINGLDYYLSERVKELTHDEQTPFTSKRAVDVTIACH
jgi:caspase domain-containing protein/WD40 domain-containing protein